MKGVGGAATQQYSHSVEKIVNPFRPKLQTNMQIKLFLSPQVYVLSKLSRCFKIECRSYFSGHHVETQREAAEIVIQERFEMDQKIPVCVGEFARLLGNFSIF